MSVFSRRPSVALAIGGTGLALLSVLSLSTFAHAAGTTAPTRHITKVPLVCDVTGAKGSTKDDCLRQSPRAEAADSRIGGGRTYPMSLALSPELRRKTLLGEVQYRSVSRNGKPGKWWTNRTIVWKSKDSAARAVRAFAACAPASPGTYEVRTLLAVPATFRSAPSSKPAISGKAGSASPTPTASPTASASDSASPSPSPSVSASASTSVSPTASPSVAISVSPSGSPSPSSSTSPSASPSASASPTSPPASAVPYSAADTIVSSSVSTITVTSASPNGCANLQADQLIVEYFNEIEFSQDIEVNVASSSGTYSLSLGCPPQVNPNYPPAGFELSMSTADDSQSISCNSGSINIAASALPSLSYCQGSSPVCTFMFAVSNSATGTVFSTTVVNITLTPATLLPNLNPATLPTCSPGFNPCLLSGTCSLSSSKSGLLSLNGAGLDDTDPSTNNSYSYNENVYFQTSIQSNG